MMTSMRDRPTTTLSYSMIISMIISAIVYAALVWMGGFIGLLWWQSILIILAVCIACAVFMYMIARKYE